MKQKFIIFLLFASILNVGIISAENYAELLFEGNQSFDLLELNTSKITLKDNAYLTIQNIELETVFYNGTNTIDLNLYNNSKLTIINSSIPASITTFNSSSVEIINSTVFHAYWCRIHNSFHNGSGLFLHDLSDFIVKNSRIGYIRADGKNSGIAQGGTVMEIWSSSQESDSEIYIEVVNSSVNRVHLNQPVTKLSSIRAGYHQDLSLDQKLGSLIHLNNSELVDGLSLTYRNASLVEINNCDIFIMESIDCPRIMVSDSKLWDLVSWHSKFIELVNSSVDYFTSINENVVEIDLNRTIIGRFDGDVSHFYRLNALDSQIEDFYQGRKAEMSIQGMKIEFLNGDMEYLSMTGDYNFENNTLPVLLFGEYGKSNITINRDFPIFVNRNGEPGEDVIVDLLDNEEIRHSATTGSNGYAWIQLNFFESYRQEYNKLIHESNLTKVYTLRITHNGEAYFQNLDVYTITPIILEIGDNQNKFLLLSISALCISLIIVIAGNALRRK